MSDQLKAYEPRRYATSLVAAIVNLAYVQFRKGSAAKKDGEQVVNMSDRKPDAEGGRGRISDAQPELNGRNLRKMRGGYHPLRKIWNALAGIKVAVLLDVSVQYKLVISLVFLVIAAVFESVFHFLFVLAVTGMMLMSEIFNTAVEALCDFIQPAHDERIREIKDMAAGATLIVLAIWWVVLGVVLYEFVAARQLF